MKLGRTCAAAALLGAAALPLAAPVSWADGPGTAPVREQQAPDAPRAEQPKESAPAVPVPEATQAVPKESTPAVPKPATGDQVRQRPVGAPETGGGPVESGFDPAVLGGAAAAVAVAGGGVALVLRRRRAGAN
ncbi:hypothetical protein [Saccharopolyspora elongata]|uniref:Tat pathway signal sequence domain protein n=1 Tax=Saccharopolyspora elongata TaxID=2530387 RepID=A0A4R4YFJ7_9PSEU|nr:hypothetical protein [Saccharopolyspora elongata]TDD42012.1 hypothetical protein E1288_30770 [Saccharopolyspora elongata]